MLSDRLSKIARTSLEAAQLDGPCALPVVQQGPFPKYLETWRGVGAERRGQAVLAAGL